MFRTAWSTPLCGPSRALLHTGRYGGRTQYLDNDINPRKPFWTQHQVVGKVLQSAGYAGGDIHAWDALAGGAGTSLLSGWTAGAGIEALISQKRIRLSAPPATR